LGALKALHCLMLLLVAAVGPWAPVMNVRMAMQLAWMLSKIDCEHAVFRVQTSFAHAAVPAGVLRRRAMQPS
jgi:hypothetical protein